jgi:hypothetical protein
LALAGCGAAENPQTVFLPSSGAPPYRAYATMGLHGGMYSDNETDIHIFDEKNEYRRIAYLEDCGDVLVIPTKDYIYIFYKKITTSGGFSTYLRPNVFFCDMNHPSCHVLLGDLVRRGDRVSSVCGPRNGA